MIDLVQQGQLINTAEAAHILRVSRSTITRRVAAGQLSAAHRTPGYRGDLLFDRAAIEAAAAELAA